MYNVKHLTLGDGISIVNKYGFKTHRDLKHLAYVPDCETRDRQND